MLQNPDINKGGGLNKLGAQIVVQIDETLYGKQKYHKGRGKKQT